MAHKLTPEQRIQLSDQLVKLADLMETCDYGDSNFKAYNKDYGKIARMLFPDAYPEKTRAPRKPTRKMLAELTPCTCGEKMFKWNFKDAKITISCKSCERTGTAQVNNRLAITSWNQTFNESTLF